ncbi:MAG: hypothetical protein ABIZ49_12040, partial [Opitutaceae bacterium]
MKPKLSGRFAIKAVTLAEKGVSYGTFRVTGWLDGQRVRKQFKSREEALGEKNRLEVCAANDQIRTTVTRLSEERIREAEDAFRRLGEKSLSAAVDWYLSTYRPPVAAMTVEAAT